MVKRLSAVIGVLLLRSFLFAGTCENLNALRFTDATVASAVSVSAGGFQSAVYNPQGITIGLPKVEIKDLPAFCRVVLKITPSSDSDIRVEVWLPTNVWNHKFLAMGNGGFGGNINYASLGGAISGHYAVSATDTGHSGPGGEFALGHPEKLADYAYRSAHEMAVKAKAVILAFYGQTPLHSYWDSCSSGGRQGLKEAQLFPEDFDGIIAGSPAANWTGRSAQAVWIAQSVHRTDANAIPPNKFALLHKAVIAACDELDGVKDGVLEDPRKCQFDPAALLCKDGETDSCLTQPQIETARRIYSPVTNVRTGEVIFPGHERGSELGWRTMASPTPFSNGLDHFKYIVFRDPNWDYRTFDFDQDLAKMAAADRGLSNGSEIKGGLINALSPDLKEFFARGGKLIQYHGWSDPQISPQSSIRYYESVVGKLGAASVANSHRLFMIPGMAHCGGGEGPNMFDPLAALTQWVENQKAPDQIVASKIMDDKTVHTRPLCPYPQIAKYKGTGSTDDAKNFSCAIP